MWILHRFNTGAAAQIRVDGSALNGAGPHNRHLDDDVFKTGWLEPRQHLLLGAALDLECANCIPALEHLVDGRVVQRQFVQLRRLLTLCANVLQAPY